ncbi:hypothetical protein M153_770004285 [Pseudoloma neurophilia]|uniref:Uncharacterized protein n=1 Tax=Pseudoloma neurophilia TaxID=146866 RepID=A0A0R0M5W7_9MICR|nr:hypothetical protein M153_770004285 [Pseudoloma neurophilia]
MFIFDLDENIFEPEDDESDFELLELYSQIPLTKPIKLPDLIDIEDFNVEPEEEEMDILQEPFRLPLIQLPLFTKIIVTDESKVEISFKNKPFKDVIGTKLTKTIINSPDTSKLEKWKDLCENNSALLSILLSFSNCNQIEEFFEQNCENTDNVFDKTRDILHLIRKGEIFSQNLYSLLIDFAESVKTENIDLESFKTVEHALFIMMKCLIGQCGRKIPPKNIPFVFESQAFYKCSLCQKYEEETVRQLHPYTVQIIIKHPTILKAINSHFDILSKELQSKTSIFCQQHPFVPDNSKIKFDHLLKTWPKSLILECKPPESGSSSIKIDTTLKINDCTYNLKSFIRIERDKYVCYIKNEQVWYKMEKIVKEQEIEINIILNHNRNYIMLFYERN